MENNKPIFLTLSAFLVVAIVVGILLYLGQTQTKEEAYKSAFKEGTLLQSKGDFRARYKYEEALKYAETVEQEAVTRLNIGTAYFYSDPAMAVRVLKEIYANTEYPPRIRAGTIHYMVARYGQTFDLNFVKNYFLAGGDPWSSFATSSTPEKFTKRDAEISLRNAEEHASEIYSLFQSEYAIAYLYSAYELKENSNNKAVVSSYAKRILERVERGDVAIKANLTQRDSQYAFGYYYKAFALENLHEAGYYDDTEKIAETYRVAIQYQEKLPNTPVAIGQRLRLAMFLAPFQGSGVQNEARANVSILMSIKEGTDQFDDLEKTLTDLIKDQRYNSGLPLLANLDSEFKSLLISLDWKP